MLYNGVSKCNSNKKSLYQCLPKRKPGIASNGEQLGQAEGDRNPSSVVEKHVGVESVCEAAAILASRNGRLIVPKQSTQNVTVAIARINSMWSE